MKTPITTFLSLVILFCIGFSMCAYAQYDYIKQGYVDQSRLPHSLHRFQIGISTVGSTAYYQGDFAEQDGINFKQHYHQAPTVSKGGLGLTLGTFYRIAKIGKVAAIAFDVNGMFNMVSWKGMGQGQYSDNTWYNTAVTKQLATPIGLSIKFGSDARLEKNHRFCLSVGGGVLPSANWTRLVSPEPKDKQLKYLTFGATPYIMGETGVFLGNCFKLRFMATFGDYKLAKNASVWQEEGFGYTNFSMNAKSSFIVSLLMMPFSHDWPDNGWWNNSRTMGTYYRGK